MRAPLPDGCLVTKIDNAAFTRNGEDSQTFKVAANPFRASITSNKQEVHKGISDDNVLHSIGNGALSDQENGQPEAKEMPRTIGPLAGITIIVGTMMGCGIFVSPQGILRRSGSVALSLCIWVACGLLSALSALCYLELGLLIQESGGEIAYLYVGLGPLHRFLGPLPAFLYSWVCNLVTKPAVAAIMSLTCAQYCMMPFYTAGTSPSPMLVALVAVAINVVVTLINCYSTKLGARAQGIFTAAALLSIAVIVGAGAYSLSQGHTKHLATGFEGSTTSPGDLAKAFYSGLFAYDGWNNLNYVTEEVAEPAKNLPLAISIALPLVTVCYTLTMSAYLTQLSPAELLASPAVAYSFAEKILGSAYILIPISVAIAALGSVNGITISTPRCVWASARQGHLPEPLSYIHTSRHTPIPALVFNSLIAIVLMCLGHVGDLIEFTSFCLWIFYGLVVMTLIVMRRTAPDKPRAFRVPILVPCFILLMSCCLVIVPIVDNPSLEYVYVFAFILLGVFAYTLFVYYKWMPTCVPKIYLRIQKIFGLVQSAKPAK